MINLKKIRPMANYLLVTFDTYTAKDFEGKLQDKMEGALKEYQKVVAVGPMVRNISVGDLVRVNPSRYAKVKVKENSIKNDIDGMMEKIIRYDFNVFEVDHENYMMITDQDVYFVVEEFEEVEETNLILPKQTIIA